MTLSVPSSNSDESGQTVEQRIIRSSIKMTQTHKDAATIETVFNKFALFPEGTGTNYG